MNKNDIELIMEKKELKTIWKILSWIITAIVMLLLVMLGIVIADFIGSKSKFFSSAGFFIGLSSYALIKEILIKLTCPKNISNTYKITENEVVDYSSLDVATLSNEQLITHNIRISCQSNPIFWKQYIRYVSIALGQNVIEGKINEINTSNPNMNRDNIYELIGSDYAIKTIITDKNLLNELRSKTSIYKESIDDVIKRLSKYIQITDDKITHASATEDMTKEDVERLFAKVGARTIWLGMYEITTIKQIQNNHN